MLSSLEVLEEVITREQIRKRPEGMNGAFSNGQLRVNDSLALGREICVCPFKIAFFDASMSLWRRMPSSNLQFSIQIICQICDHVANLRMAFCDKVFQNLS